MLTAAEWTSATRWLCASGETASGRVLTDIDRALTEAFERLMHGLPELTDGKITVVNLCTEAGASCASYYRSQVGDDSSAQLPPPTPERVAKFFDFLKARIATARKYGPAARDNAMWAPSPARWKPSSRVTAWLWPPIRPSGSRPAADSAVSMPSPRP
ncbi:hypothetical protein ACFYRG_45520 [Streptomyces mirabilis]|uniref:hypothetical protein n=1 Tax=Streptomyces mirabilis TaxID=68239 RepID=UPI0036A92C8E